MCLSIPGKIIEISENKYVIEYPEEKRIVNISLVDNLKSGDYVVVSNKIIINKVPKEQVEKFFKIIKVMK